MNSYFSSLRNDRRFIYEDGLFYQVDFPRNNSFEERYLRLREKEGRVYSDSVASLLPEFSGQPNLSTEWKIRKRSADRLVEYAQHKQPSSIIEVGCGNGWLIHYLNQHVHAECLGIDINEPELKQASRISSNAASCFLYGDVLSDAVKELRADMILVASAAHYFSDLKLFVERLLTLLTPVGEVHIIDTPFYSEEEAEHAKSRSQRYFKEMGVNQAGMNYYHHSLNAIESINYQIAYQPHSLFNQLKRKVTLDSPFPWIILKNN